MKHRRGMAVALVGLTVALASPGGLVWGGAPALAATVSWDGATGHVDAGGVPRAALERRPDWAAEPVAVDGDVVWAVAILPPSVRTWNDRLAAGSRQAQQRLFAVAEEVVQARAAADPPDYQARLLASARYRLDNLVDRESFIKVQTVERPVRLGQHPHRTDRLQPPCRE